jgi:phosphatidylinositol alpha-1,6-mannosyltransferase
MPLGVDPDAFSMIGECSRKEGLILSVGAVKPRKGYEYAIRAFGRIASQVPQAEYVIVGRVTNAGFRDRLLTIAAECGVGDRVRFVADASDDVLKRCYAKASVFVLPSVNEGAYFEGFGLVYLEAAATGLPTIGTRDCGAADAIIDGVTGFLVPQRDVDSLAVALLRLLMDRDLCRQMGAAGRRIAAEHTWQLCAKRTRAMYDAVMRPSNVLTRK